ncbi:hypothetical protein GCM10009347_16140 [Shewanella algicola]|uniref:DUF2806 domain-containing protein n=1 Tax=Shewanella algicola TaxID=640633 RepID=A0A9X1Z4J5_9GAMM|nr:DUF2806 domain-containing protein [Shewanella algicola]MCL1105871.1 DUF2806 domain-containing protein [Shewanella algicola]GGP49880.1 hypothetical protein GCM10009347_16140 [Shewanella algicola]
MLGEKLLIKLWETLAKDGIGSLASPWQIKREGKAHAEVRRDEMLMLAQAEVEAEQIKLGKKKLLDDGRLIELGGPKNEEDHSVDYLGRLEPTISLDSFSEKIEQQRKAEEIQQEININKTIGLAEEELLRSQQEPSEKEVDSDWLSRWRDHAKSTNSEELRQIWARTLAGEVKSPGSYSLRTLEFIKNLSQEEAMAISKLGQFAVGRSIFKCPQLEKQGIDFNFLLQMDDLGIVNGVQGGQVSGLKLTFNSREADKFSNVLVNRNQILLIEAEDPNKKLALGCYQISKIGAEVLSLGDFNANENYMRELGEEIKKKGFDVKIALWVQTHAEYGNYFNAQPI